MTCLEFIDFFHHSALSFIYQFQPNKVVAKSNQGYILLFVCFSSTREVRELSYLWNKAYSLQS